MISKFVKIFVSNLVQARNLSSKGTFFAKSMFVFLFGIPVLFTFQNCSGNGFGSLDDENISTFSSNLGSSILDPGNASAIAAGKALYTQSCAGCHGAVDSSSKRGRSAPLITMAIKSIPQMSALKSLTSEQIQLIGQALDVSSSFGNADGRSIFVCDPSNVPKTPLLKLTNREFRAALLTLLDGFGAKNSPKLSSDAQLVSTLNNLPSDSVVEGRTAMREQPMLLSKQMVSGYFEAAFRAGTLASTANGLATYPNTGGCLAAATVTQSCHQSLVRELGTRAFRRPLSTAEASSLAASLWDVSLSKADLIKLTFTSITQMPDFMYKIFDHGSLSSRGPRVLNLTAHELASKVSFFLTGMAPDATLMSLADSGQILNSTILSQQVDRLMTLPAAQDMIRRLFRESYAYDSFDRFEYSSAFLQGLNPSNLNIAMVDEMDNFFIDTVLTRQGTFQDIMTSQNARIPTTALAQVYGLSSAGTTVLPASRSGFINRAAFLAKRSGNYTSPVHRGLSVLEGILCEDIGDPPPDAPTSVSEEQITDQLQSTRQRYHGLTEVAGTSCIVCHSRINSFGYAFENFDSIGRQRTQERVFASETGPSVGQVPIDTRSTILDLKAESVTVRDSYDLASELSKNDKAIMCFVRHLKNFESRRSASAADNCQLNSSLNVLYGVNGTQGTIQQAIKSLILSNDFKVWSY